MSTARTRLIFLSLYHRTLYRHLFTLFSPARTHRLTIQWKSHTKKITWNLYAEKFSEHFESATTCCYCFVTFSCSFSRRHKTRIRKKSSIHHRNKEKKRQRIIALNIRFTDHSRSPFSMLSLFSLILFLILFFFLSNAGFNWQMYSCTLLRWKIVFIKSFSFLFCSFTLFSFKL